MDKIGRAGLYSLGVNLFLVVLKFGLSAVSGSLALAADAVHSLVDVVGSLVVLAGVVIAGRKAKSFPYGLYKVENVVSVVVALLIFLAAYEMAREALVQPVRQLSNAPLALLGAILAAAIAYLFGRYEQRLGGESGSPSLLADSQHFRSDVLSSGVVLAAVAGNAAGLPLDRLGAAVIAVFVARAGWGLLVDGMRVLLDASLDQETLTTVRKLIGEDRNVAEIRSLVGRNSGRFRFLEAELVLRTRDLEKAHQISSRIEAAIKASVPHVDRVLIHYEPRRSELRKWAIPLADLEGTVSPHFGQAPYFSLVTMRAASGEVTDSETLANPYANVEKQKGIRAAEFLIAQGVDGLVLRGALDGKGPVYVLADAGVEVALATSVTTDGVLEEIRHANL
jgi:cation diffusion facilitator family transporter